MITNQSKSIEEVLSLYMKILAWGTIFIATVPQIIYRLIIPVVPGEPYNPIWLVCLEVVFLIMVWVLTMVWGAARPLRGFVLAILAILIGTFFIVPLISESGLWLNWMKEASWGVKMIVGRLMVHLPIIALMVLTLIGSGIGRQKLYLVRGNPGAPCQPSRLLPVNFNRTVSWPRVILQWLPFYIIIMLVILAIQIRPDLSQITQAFFSLPAIVIAATINAIGEEFEYRSMILARVAPVLGSQSAILMAAVIFGLMHYFGTPGGPFGVILTGYFGWINAKSMIETRGFIWAFLIHFFGDFTIYCFWAMLI